MSESTDDVEKVRENAKNNILRLLMQFHANTTTPSVPNDEQTIRTKSRLIERGVWNYSIKASSVKGISLNWQTSAFRTVYKNRYLAVFLNLKREHNGLAKRILDQQVLPKYVGEHMTTEEMDPGKVEMDNKKRDKMIRSNVIPSSIDVGPSLVKCRRCCAEHRDAYKVTTYMQQTRSADEPTTVFCHCTVCDIRWRTT